MSISAPARRPSAFRAHHHRPPLVTSHLFSSLIDEWIRLNNEQASSTAVARWARVEPVLAGHTWPCDIVDAIDAAPLEQKNQLMGALLRLVQKGHQLAGRILLQQMLPSIGKLTKTTPRNADDAKDNRWAEDRRHIAIAEFWDLISHYPTHRQPTNLPGTLHMEMVHRLFSRRPETPTVLAGDAEDVWNVAGNPAAVHDEDSLVPDGLQLADLLTWAVDRQVISPYEADLLTTVYIDTSSPDTPRVLNRTAGAAARWNIKPALVRLHCHRAADKLRHAVRESVPA